MYIHTTFCSCRPEGKKKRCQVPKENTVRYLFHGAYTSEPILQVSAKVKECSNNEMARSLVDEIQKGPLSCSSPVKTM